MFSFLCHALTFEDNKVLHWSQNSKMLKEHGKNKTSDN
jgi:hypothetical protein